MSLAVAFHTSRRDPKFSWFFDSLAAQKGIHRVKQIIIVDFYAQVCDDWRENDVTRRLLEIVAAAKRAGLEQLVEIHPVKPTIWQGPYRITKENWWAASAVRNTSICFCKQEWLVMLDDRCVLQPGYLQAVKRAMSYKYVVAGSYQKRHNLVVEKGVIRGEGTVTGVDNRESLASSKIVKATGAWTYGCSIALPLEWALQVNGFAEDYCDGISMEDIILGMCLHNSGFPIRYDPSMRMIEDRTPSECTAVFRREDKGVSPNDKSHKLLEVFAKSKTSLNSFDIRQVRKDVLAGKPFPPPSANHHDWYDGNPIVP
jgi:hypothetical protein